MTKDTSPEQDARPKSSDTKSEPEEIHRHEKHRRHGYRGYPNNTDVGGAIHHGSGMGGVGATQGSGGGSGSIFTDKTRESVEELADEEDEK
ncbi:MAG TPA: hypothetical protein VH854_14780 [Thermoanaerobaculia bacterium]|jgi:hypothetical protein|nr:hypothetical protein [Thermoanaerobaculia bacterium]